MGSNPYPGIFGNRYPDELLASFPWRAPAGAEARTSGEPASLDRLRLGLRRRTAILDGFAKSVAIGVAAVSGIILNACGQQQKSVQPAPQPTPSQARLFSPRSFWNAPLTADAAIDPRSAQMVGGLVGEVQSELTRHFGPWINTRQYSTPVYTVGAHQPTVRVTLDRDLPDLQEAISSVPIPPGAKPAAGSDRHMVVWQPDTDRMWEFWRMRRAGGALARWRRRCDAPRIDQPRLLQPRLLARRPAMVGRHRHRPAAARRPDDDPGAEAGTHRPRAGDGDS